MMVETVLESSQDFAGMSGGVPQWKRELLQRRAARVRPAPPQPPPPPPAPPPPDDEELRYGPGIVKRLQSRYLSLALRDAPRRRAAVLRRAASLEQLLDAPPPPPPRPRPASHHAHLQHLAPAPAARRDSIKRARSVDALSRFERRVLEPAPARPAPASSPSPAQRAPVQRAPSPARPAPSATQPDPADPAPASFPARTESAPAQSASPPVTATAASPPVTATASSPPVTTTVAPPCASSIPAAPPVPRSGRPPRRPQPLLRETERPPADLVRSALRKFEPGAARRAAPAARVAAVLRGLEPRTSTPEPRARAGSPAPAPASPAADLSAISEPEPGPRPVSRAALEGIARAGSSVLFSFPGARAGSHLPPLAATNPVLVARRVGVIRPLPPATPPPPPAADDDAVIKAAPRFASPPPVVSSPCAEEHEQLDKKESPPSAAVEPVSRSPLPRSPLQEMESDAPAWERRTLETPERCKPEPLLNGHKDKSEVRLNGALPPRRAASPPAPAPAPAAWARRGGRAPDAGATSVVFNFVARAAVPDYIENDGIILRASRREKLKAGDPGVVVLGGAVRCESSSEEEGECGQDAGDGVEPLVVRFVNDNVLINGRSSLAARRARQDKLKLQFDDSLTRTFEYPSESSLCDHEPSPTPAPAPAAALAANTHIASAALSGYTPSKTLADAFQLGVTRHAALAPHADVITDEEPTQEEALAVASWSEARQGHTDLLF